MKNLVQIIFVLLTFMSAWNLHAQPNTIGVISVTDEVADGYTLFAPNSSTTTYLIDNCGNTINTWESEKNPGLSAYLMPNGNLIRTRREPNTVFFAGGVGGGIEIFDWSGNLIWEFVLANGQNILHHDIAPMENGNILAIAYDLIPQTVALNLGRELQVTPSGGMWIDKIIEIKPLPNNGFEIVWEWSSIQHIVQDVNPSLSNFGELADSPEKLDFNYSLSSEPGTSANSDWMHSNAIDYNEELDQIILNSRNFSEFYIIDHSTTTAEASGSVGGRQGKGGDLLFRWGNPRAYNSGSNNDRRLFSQHDANWIDKGLKDEGKVFVFNNGVNRPGGTVSTVDLIATPILADGSYEKQDGAAFGPVEAEWTYGNSAGDISILSPRISGVSKLPNDNVLIVVGAKGRLIELNENREIVWDYILPTAGSEVQEQGSDPTFNSTFRAYKYPLDYPPFLDNAIFVDDPIELNPNNQFCDVLLPTETVLSDAATPRLVNNLVQNQLIIRSPWAAEVAIIDVYGGMHSTYNLYEGEQALDVSRLPAGMFFVKYINAKYSTFESLPFVKVK